VKGCRRNLLDEAVGIDYIKRYLTDLEMGSGDMFRPPQIATNGKRVAVVGAGPAGLSCANYLALEGYQVDMFESQPEAGGMLRYGIPEYRLPKDVLDLEINQILGLGVTLKTNTWLGKDFTVTSLKQDGYQAIFLGIGAWRSSLMRVQGEDAPAVLSGIEFLKNFGLRKKIDISGRVAVVGGGNTAIDCARTALRLGVDEVRLLYRRTEKEMPANEMEIHEAKQEGVIMDFLVAPVKVVTRDGRLAGLECLRMELGEPDASGRRSPKPIRGSEFRVECDYVLSAIGQSTTVTDLVGGKVPGFLPLGEVLNLTRWQTIQVNEKTFETSVEGVFSGGDVVTGAATAIEAIAAGRKAAHAIDSYIRTGAAQPEPEEFNSRKDVFAKVSVKDLKSQVSTPRRIMPVLPVSERIKSFVEVEQGYTADDMKQEVTRCLECGCVALFDCDLRRYATEYGVNVKRFLGEANQYQIDSTHPLIELDPNKCVLCGRCVRVCSEVVGVSAYGYINRGFGTVVMPALGGSLLDTECVSCGLCIGTCPTGAIVQKISLAKPGPWKTDQVRSVCHYCGVGCTINYDVFGDTLVKSSRDEGNGVTYGSHCRKGRFGFGYVHAHDRLTKARIRPGREMQDAPVGEALGYAALRLKELSRHVSGREIAVFVSPRLTNEEVYLAQKLARIALKTHNVTSFAHLINRDLCSPEVAATANYKDLVDAQTLLVVNANPDEEHFVVDLLGKRAVRNGGRLIYVGPDENRTAQFAEVFLQCRPEEQTTAVLGLLAEYARITGTPADVPAEIQAAMAGLTPEEVERRSGAAAAAVREAAQVLAKSILKVLVFNRDYRGPRKAGDTRLLAAVAPALGCAVLPMHEKANMQGLLDMGASPGWYPGYQPVGDSRVIDEFEKEWCVALRDLEAGDGNIARLLAEKKIKVAIVLGEDPLACESLPPAIREGLLATEFLVVGDLFLTETAKAANVVLPLSSAAETSGTFTNSERRVQQVRRAIPPKSGIETWEILCQLGARMGYRFKMKYGHPDEVFEEIRRVAPIYHDLAIGSEEADSIWDLSRFHLAGVGPAYQPDAPAITPAATLPLDHLEGRFARWFTGLFPAVAADKAESV
jgi:formate dehydrogenase major subunit